MVTFEVSQVERAAAPLPGLGARASIEALGGAPVEAWWTPSGPLVKTSAAEQPFHPLVAAVHAAFDQHRPLTLSPDAVWLCVAQGLAAHVKANAEALRGQVVAHQGSETLVVLRDQFLKGSPENDWPGVFAELSAEVGKRTGELRGLVVADFSTTDATSRAVSELALLSAVRPYFKYQVHTRCGIPSITLTGTADDWRSIHRRASALARFETQWWLAGLLPVLEQFVAAAEGRVDLEHWSSLYRVKSVSGGPYLTGWINALLPYVLDGDGKVARNPWVADWRNGLSEDFGGGVTLDGLPGGLSCVPFLWRYLGSEFRMEFVGGFAGVAMDPATGSVGPELGWAVRESPNR